MIQHLFLINPPVPGTSSPFLRDDRGNISGSCRSRSQYELFGWSEALFTSVQDVPRVEKKWPHDVPLTSNWRRTDTYNRWARSNDEGRVILLRLPSIVPICGSTNSGTEISSLLTMARKTMAVWGSAIPQNSTRLHLGSWYIFGICGPQWLWIMKSGPLRPRVGWSI